MYSQVFKQNQHNLLKIFSLTNGFTYIFGSFAHFLVRKTNLYLHFLQTLHIIARIIVCFRLGSAHIMLLRFIQYLFGVQLFFGVLRACCTAWLFLIILRILSCALISRHRRICRDYTLKFCHSLLLRACSVLAYHNSLTYMIILLQLLWLRRNHSIVIVIICSCHYVIRRALFS